MRSCVRQCNPGYWWRALAFVLLLSAASSQRLPLHAQPSETVAFTNGREIRLVEADGRNERVIWTEPSDLFSISSIVWRPDGAEIAFASDHEMATSFYERDIYAIRPDGSGLRRLTNSPKHEELAAFPKGSVTVTVTNLTLDGGPYFIYVLGAPEPQSVTVNAGSSVTLTFTDVADFGDGVFQPAVVINGIFRWWDAAAAADVVPGSTASAGHVTISGTGDIEHFGASGPFWRSDGSAVGFFGTPCILQYVPADPLPGHAFNPIVGPDVFTTPCTADWSPIPATADQLLVAEYGNYSETGEVQVYRVPEGSPDRGNLVTTFDGYVELFDLRWIPDGSGFLVAKHDDLLDRSVNLYEFNFDSEVLTPLTNLSGEEQIRSFSLSSDGQFVVYEHAASAEDLPGDVWIMRRDGSDKRLLVRGGSSPAWRPQTLGVGAEVPEESSAPRHTLTAYPQPARSETTLSFSLQEPQEAILTVHDILGRERYAYSLGYKMPGFHTARFDAASFESGVYLVSITGDKGERMIGRVIVSR